MAPRLSKTARRVLELLATGRSAPEVAAILGVPVATVRRDLVRAMLALGAASKLEAIISAIQDGQIDPTQFM